MTPTCMLTSAIPSLASKHITPNPRIEANGPNSKNQKPLHTVREPNTTHRKPERPPHHPNEIQGASYAGEGEKTSKNQQKNTKNIFTSKRGALVANIFSLFTPPPPSDPEPSCPRPKTPALTPHSLNIFKLDWNSLQMPHQPW